MFDRLKPEQSQQSTQQQQPVQNPQSVSVSSQQQGRVYTMPEKFMPQQKKGGSLIEVGTRAGSGAGTAKPGKKKWLIIALSALLVIIFGSVVTALILQRTATNTPTNTNTAAQTTNTNRATNTTNRNSNTNATNQPKNTNADLNVNQGLLNNINGQLFPSNTNTSTSTNTNSGSTSTQNEPNRSNVVDSKDKDKDGLTDDEEVLYGTTSTLPDTDKDGFVDGSEVLNGYSPNAASKTLLESGLTLKYKQSSFGWTMDYPADWLADAANETNKEVFFTSDTVEGEFVQVVFVDNTLKQTAAEWYASLYKDIDPDDLTPVTLGGLQGIVSTDGFSYYVATTDYIIGIVYNFGTKTEIHFRNTFKMMIDTFTYTAPKPKPSNTNSNSNANSNTNAASNINTNSNSNANTNSATGLPSS